MADKTTALDGVKLPPGYLSDDLPEGHEGAGGRTTLPVAPGYRVVTGRDTDEAKRIMRYELDMRQVPAGSGVVLDETNCTTFKETDGKLYLRYQGDVLWMETEAHCENRRRKEAAARRTRRGYSPAVQARVDRIRAHRDVALTDGPPPPPGFNE
jgi:hypothetical protein